MQLPNIENAQIAPEKVRDYLLSDSHPIGRYKATVFKSLGYSSDRWETLREDLRKLLILDAEELEPSEFGEKYSYTTTSRSNLTNTGRCFQSRLKNPQCIK